VGKEEKNGVKTIRHAILSQPPTLSCLLPGAEKQSSQVSKASGRLCIVRDAADIPSEMLRLRVEEAAQVLGISTGAVRNRLSRGTLKSVKEDGTVYVLVDRNMSQNTDDMHGEIPGESTALISAKDETIRVLREQLEAEREQLAAERNASAELRRIIAGLIQRVPELEPVKETPSDPQEPAENAEETTKREGAPPPADAPHEEDTGRPWWRRWFG
jgi:hypothetical protein